MDVGAKVGLLVLGCAAFVGVCWLLWVRFIGLPTDDPTSSPSRLGDPGVTDPGAHHPPHA